MTAAGLRCIGRFANRSYDMTAKFIQKHISKTAPIIWWGENDQKSDGSWPGHTPDVAKKLSDEIDREVLYVEPPDGAKDVRAWLTAPERAGMTWEERGATLARLLKKSAVRVCPQQSQYGESGLTVEDDRVSKLVCIRPDPPIQTNLLTGRPTATERLMAERQRTAPDKAPPEYCNGNCHSGVRKLFGRSSAPGTAESPPRNAEELLLIELACDRYTCVVCSRAKKKERSASLTRAIITAAAVPDINTFLFDGPRHEFDAYLKRYQNATTYQRKKDKSFPRVQYCSVTPGPWKINEPEHLKDAPVRQRWEWWRPQLELSNQSRTVGVIFTRLAERPHANARQVSGECAPRAVRDAITEIRIGTGIRAGWMGERFFRYSDGFCPVEKSEPKGWKPLGDVKVSDAVAEQALLEVKGMQLKSTPGYGATPGRSRYAMYAFGKPDAVDYDQLDYAEAKITGWVELDEREQEIEDRERQNRLRTPEAGRGHVRGLRGRI